MANFLDLLHSEHETVKDLFQKIESTEDSMKKEQYFNQLKHDILPHMRGEEKYFYPVLQEKQEYREPSLEAIEEHHAAKLILNEIDEMDVEDERWSAKAKVLQEMIEHHIEEEESTIFDAARQSISQEQMKQIEERFESEKSRV